MLHLILSNTSFGVRASAAKEAGAGLQEGTHHSLCFQTSSCKETQALSDRHMHQQQQVSMHMYNQIWKVLKSCISITGQVETVSWIKALCVLVHEDSI
jgi:hypothetical protein